MSDKKNNDYLIDIASDSQYQNQSDEYYKSYTRWRMNENNRFGYKFVKDKREHTYAYGEGYEHKKASDAEKKALRNCASLTGGCLLVAAFLRLMQEIFDSGTSTVSCFAVFALRILVSISAIGSFVVVILMTLLS